MLCPVDSYSYIQMYELGSPIVTSVTTSNVSLDLYSIFVSVIESLRISKTIFITKNTGDYFIGNFFN